MRAEADSRRDVDTHLVQHVAREADGVIPVRNRRPHIECRARSFYVPAEVVQGVRDQPMAPRVYIAGGARLLVSPIERLDGGPLDGLENPRVDVRLQLADEPPQVPPPPHPPPSPPCHVELTLHLLEL